MSGRNPLIIAGDPVTEADRRATESRIGMPIPTELWDFIKEMGDGYYFRPSENDEGIQIGRLGEFQSDFVDILREEAPPGPNHSHPAEVVAEELARRERWFPFYNFGWGGYLFCLDLNISPSPVRYYERCYWPTDPIEHWQLSMADSLEDFIRQWSRYCFANAKGATLINLALSARGRFDWAPNRFEPWCDRGTIEA